MSGPPSSSPFSARVAAILIAVAAISFGAVLVMAGWAPELRERNRAGDHPYSTSALGYNGFVRLLEDGSVALNTGAVDIGQGSNTTLTQICAAALGVEPDHRRLDRRGGCGQSRRQAHCRA